MKKCLLPFASALVTLVGFTNTAQANYGITLDNYGTSGFPTWAASGGTITIHTKINGVWAEVCEIHPSIISANLWCHISSVFDSDDVEGIWMTTDSTDGFFLDQFSLWKWTSPLTYDHARTWGVDNNAGWCFSTEDEGPYQYCPHGWSHSWFWEF